MVETKFLSTYLSENWFRKRELMWSYSGNSCLMYRWTSKVPQLAKLFQFFLYKLQIGINWQFVPQQFGLKTATRRMNLWYTNRQRNPAWTFVFPCNLSKLKDWVFIISVKTVLNKKHSRTPPIFQHELGCQKWFCHLPMSSL